jgi:hypothetical protein
LELEEKQLLGWEALQALAAIALLLVVIAVRIAPSIQDQPQSLEWEGLVSAAILINEEDKEARGITEPQTMQVVEVAVLHQLLMD